MNKEIIAKTLDTLKRVDDQMVNEYNSLFSWNESANFLENRVRFLENRVLNLMGAFSVVVKAILEEDPNEQSNRQQPEDLNRASESAATSTQPGSSPTATFSRWNKRTNFDGSSR